MEIKQRDTYFDFLRGVAIFMVIGIHTYSDGFAHANLIFRQFLNCAVPLFLAISGYFIGKKSFDTKETYFVFLKKQLPRVYIPMLICSIPWIALEIRGGADYIHTVLYALIGGMSIFYFIPLIMQYYVLTPLIQKMNRSVVGVGVIIIITILGISTFKYCVTIKNLTSSMVLSGSPFPVWLLFYSMGVQEGQGIKSSWRLSTITFFAILGVVLSSIEVWLTYKYYGIVNHGIKPFSHFFSYFAILIFFHPVVKQWISSLFNKRIYEWICTFGRLSFFIYLTHMMLLLLLRKFIIWGVWYVEWAVLALISFCVAALFYKYCPPKFRKYIGF